MLATRNPVVCEFTRGLLSYVVLLVSKNKLLQSTLHAKHCDRNFLKEQCEQCADDSQEHRNCQRQERGWILDQMRGELHSRRKADRCHAQPEQFASEKQDHHANQDAENWNGKVHWREKDLRTATD